MQEIDFLIDANPKLAIEMVNCDIQNKLAHSELEAYNDHKVFLYKHPIVKQNQFYNKTLSELYELKKDSPEAFMKEVTNVSQNIRRIESQIRTKKYNSEEELLKLQKNLEKATAKTEIIIELLKT